MDSLKLTTIDQKIKKECQRIIVRYLSENMNNLPKLKL